MIGLSFCGWSFLLWFFHIWYEVMSNNRYKFLLLFPLHCFSQVATNFTFNLDTSVILLLLKCLPSNASKKLHAKIVEHKLEASFNGQFSWHFSSKIEKNVNHVACMSDCLSDICNTHTINFDYQRHFFSQFTKNSIQHEMSLTVNCEYEEEEWWR